MKPIHHPIHPVAPRLILVWAAWAALWASRGNAEEVGWQVLDRDAAVRAALAQNLELRAANWEVKKARARLRWSGKLDAPELGLSASTDQLGLDDDESVLEIGIAQRFPLTDRLKREKAVSRVEVAMAEAEIADARRKLIGQVERQFYQTRVAQEEIGQLAEIRELLSGFVKTLQRQVEQGTVSSLDVNQAKLDLQQIEKEWQRQKTEAERQMGTLKTLLGVANGTRLSLQDKLELPEGEPGAPDRERARNRRPDFQLAVLKGDKARAELALAESNRWEDVAVRLFAQREATLDEPTGLERNHFVGVGVTIPLPLKRERVTDVPTAEVGQAEDESRALALRIENEVAAAAKVRSELLTLARDTAGETLQLAEENLDAISKAYSNGQIELLKYQRAQEQLLKARLGALGSLASYLQAEVDLREAAASHPDIDVLDDVSK
ncbi:MAG: TolC family protein [Verrucomicrobiae bacterium]|nr:TolC family protein [Verrucomicrobiae bacterium]